MDGRSIHVYTKNCHTLALLDKPTSAKCPNRPSHTDCQQANVSSIVAQQYNTCQVASQERPNKIVCLGVFETIWCHVRDHSETRCGPIATINKNLHRWPAFKFAVIHHQPPYQPSKKRKLPSLTDYLYPCRQGTGHDAQNHTIMPRHSAWASGYDMTQAHHAETCGNLVRSIAT